MEIFNKIVLGIAVATIPSISFAQSEITGHITDATTGEPLIGASVVVKGDKKEGVVTDTDGNFTLNTQVEAPLKLKVEYIGYRPIDLEVYDTETPVEVKLRENQRFLNEVVVIGYGTQKRENVASSISSINNKTFKDVPVTSIDQVLQGRASGVSLTTPSGNVGQAPIVKIRGVASITSGTQPLYIVDGVPVQTGSNAQLGDVNALADINADDILSIDVLKDAAAAAVYGSRAANGVVLITTKKGQQGNAKVSYNGWVGIANASKFFDVMNAQQYVDFKNLAVKNRYGTDEISLTNGYKSQYGNKAFNLMKNADGSYVDTQWKDYVLRTGLQQNHTVSISGGNDKVLYYASGNFNKQSGILKGDEYRKTGLTANVSAQTDKWLKVGFSGTGSVSKQQTGDRSRKGELVSYSGFTRLALSDAPNIPAYASDGTPYQEGGRLGYGPNTIQFPLTNPIGVLESGSVIKTEDTRLIGNAFAELTPFKGLTLRTQYGVDYMKIEDRNFFAATTVEGVEQNGTAENYSIRSRQYTWTNTANYKFSLGSHNFDILAGVESYSKSYDQWGAEKSGLNEAKFNFFEGPFSNIVASDSKITESELLSYLGRINYDYDSRYIFSVNFRRDGFSALSKNNRWGNFGGVSAAWDVSREKFFSPLKNILANLRLKASWGIVGNTNIDEYASKSYYSSSYYGKNGSYVIGQIGDTENLKWESSEKWNVGFSTDLFNKVNVSLEYYTTTSSDLILAVPVAPSKGVPGNSIISNAGKMSNRGIELGINALVISTKDFSWSTSFNLTTNRNRVEKLSDNVQEIISTGLSETTNITVPGKSIGQLYLYPTGGIDEKTGRRIFYGEDGTKVLLEFEKEGKFFTEDGKSYPESKIKRVIAGNTLPTFYGGWNNNITYRNFDLSILFQFSGGNKIYNGTKATMSDVRWWNNSKDVWNNYWREDRTNAKYAKPVWGDNYSNGSAMPITDWVEDGDYLRLKNISLGYTFGKLPFLEKAGISKLRVYAQAQNLFVLTGYEGLDPEVLSNTNSANLNGGTDHNTAPQARTFTFGVNVTF